MRKPTKYDPADHRHCLGDVDKDHNEGIHGMIIPFNMDYGMRFLPTDNTVGGGNDSLKKRRPKAEMMPDESGGSLEHGYSFRVKMAGQAQDPDMEDF